MSTARPRPRTPEVTEFTTLVDDALSPARLQGLAHPDDWPDGVPAPGGLPRTTWDAAMGDVVRDILGRPSRRFRGRMCELAWRLADGAGDIPSSLPAMVEIIHAGSLIVDDIEDGSRVRRGGPSLHLVHGFPRALNAGNWMYFWAIELTDELALPAATRDCIQRALVGTMHRCHLGQALDLSVAVGTLSREWVYRTVATCTMLKTGALMELAARVGALAAGAPAERVEELSRFGRRLGLGLQMLDDFANLGNSANFPGPHASAGERGESKTLEDLRNGRPTWPWARAALELDDPTFAHLQASARALAEGGDSDDSRARALAAALRMAVGLSGRRQTSIYLRQALEELREVVGDRSELALLTAEIQRLEASYG